VSDFKAKMHQIRFRLRLHPRPRWGAYSAPSDPLAGFKAPTSKGREGRGWEAEGMEGREGREKGREGERGDLLQSLREG